MDNNIINNLISDYDIQLAKVNRRNKGEFLEIKTLTFTVILRHQTYNFIYVDEKHLLCIDTRTQNETMIDIKRDFKKLLKHAYKTGYKLKCIRDNGSFIYFDFTKKSAFYNLAVLIDRYIC